MTAPPSFFPEHPGTVAYDLEISEGVDAAGPGMVLQQRRREGVDRLNLPSAGAVNLMAALLETIAAAHPSFFDNNMRDMLQRIVDELPRPKQTGAS
jgi:hypothetical protein